MSDKKLRWGILGVANINERWIPGFQKATLAELTAIASRSLDRAESARKAWGMEKAFGSYESLLASPDVDAVYVPLPNSLHGEWVRRAADAGKHVLCEKPLTPTAPEAQELVEYCRARKVTLMDGFMWPHHPRTARIRALIDEGAIGRVERVSGAFTFPLPMDAQNIRLNADLAGGSLLDVGCYPVYGIRWAFGEEPARVYATARYDYEVDLEMSGIVWLADGRVGTFDCGFTLPLRQWLEITGEKGVIRVQDMWLPDAEARFTLEREGGVEVMSVPGHNQIAAMIDDFSRAVLSQTPAAPDAEEAVKSLRVMDALARSAAEEREMDV
jgi:D-xylose 1-dehydrogenase (NADP+, D-xylono-1,5-lactone-forming)